MGTDVEGTLSLTDWGFLPKNEWSADVNFEKFLSKESSS